MSIEHVEVDEVRKDQSTRRLIQCRDRLIDRLLIVLRVQILRNTNRIVDRSNLPYADNIEVLISKGRQQILARRRNSLVVTILCPIEASRITQERTRNHSSNLVFPIQNPTRRLAHFVQACKWNNFFMSGDLKHRV